MSVTILRADARMLPLADESVDLIVSSPPYWSLRAYQDNGETYDGQIGAEATPGEFVDALIDCTREWMRVLKPSGSMWINLGDKYNAYNGNRGEGTIQANGVRQGAPKGHGLDVKDVRAKSLIGIPWRYAIRCIDDLGLILRAEVIWSKPNGLPESVTDRVRRSHETWLHFTKEPRYFSAVDEIREEHIAPGRQAGKNALSGMQTIRPRGVSDPSEPNPLGKLPGSVWTIATQPLTVPAHLGVDHFAAFPMEMPRRIIRGWSPSGVCVECGEGRRPVAEATGRIVASSGSALLGGDGEKYAGRNDSHAPVRTATGWSLPKSERVLTGYACACPDTTGPTTPGVVLDPFGGTGTTALVASVLGRHGVSVDMSADYCRLATWRTTDPDQIARAMQVDKPARQVEGQADLFDHLEETP